MKTPRFFIALTVYAVASTIALSSIESVFRPASAETLPVLRVNPWAGDPEEPKGPMEMPFEEDYLSIDSGDFDYSRSTSLSPSTSAWVWHSRRPHSLIKMLMFGLRW